MLRTSMLALSTVLALYYPFCAPQPRITLPPEGAPIAELWQSPDGANADGLYRGAIPTRDLYYGPWGAEHAPDPRATYTLIARKQQGTNPGLTVRDPQGREWHVKQPPHTEQGAEGPVEVVLSRVLAAVGYHQPPVYFVPSLTVTDATGTHVEPGGRFRLALPSIQPIDTWSWQRNPFVGLLPYQGLLVILTMFGSSDLKNDNNALYRVNDPADGPRYWFVVRDLGTALGETGRLAPLRNNPDRFEREPFILTVTGGFVRFNYRGWHQELLRHITRQDVGFAARLLSQLSDRQWRDAFRAGGYAPQTATRFIARLQQKIQQARQVAAGS